MHSFKYSQTGARSEKLLGSSLSARALPNTCKKEESSSLENKAIFSYFSVQFGPNFLETISTKIASCYRTLVMDTTLLTQSSSNTLSGELKPV